MANLTPRMSAAEYLRVHGGPARRRQGGKRANKYGARRTRIGSEVFDSGAESRTHQALLLAKNAARPRDRVLSVQRSVPFELVPRQDGERPCRYVADFVVDYADGRTEVIDTKSTITRRNPLYILKRKLMLLNFGIRIVEVSG